MSKAAAHILAHGAEIQSLFKQVEGINEPLTARSLENIAKAHGSLVNLLTAITADQQALRSFASKYMHFHNPAVPIFDDWAARTLRSIIRWTRSLMIFQTPEEEDEQYLKYLGRFAELYRRASAALPVTVRGLDVYLLSVANENAARRVSLATTAALPKAAPRKSRP